MKWRNKRRLELAYEKRKVEEVWALVSEEIEDMIFEEQIESGDCSEKFSEYIFPISTGMPRYRLASMNRQSVTSSLMKC